MKISWVIVTWNRRELVQEVVSHNQAKAGRQWDELVWVDNGSTDGMESVAKSFHADAILLHQKNLGVSKGYNRAYALTTGDWIVSTGDRNYMPDNWLKMMTEMAETGQVDSVSIWEGGHEAPERRLPGPDTHIGGHHCRPAIAYGSICFRRSMLRTAGYLREDLGMYGWNDCEWAGRMAIRHARSYVILDHLGWRAPDVECLMEGKSYRQWRDEQVASPSTRARLDWCIANGHPYYNPFSGEVAPEAPWA